MSHVRTTWAPMPRKPKDWTNCYQISMADDRLAPRVGPGEVLIFDPKAVPEVGNIVMLWCGEVGDPATSLIGILSKLGPKLGRLSFDLEGKDGVNFHRDTVGSIHAAVGCMVPVGRVHKTGRTSRAA